MQVTVPTSVYSVTLSFINIINNAWQIEMEMGAVYEHVTILQKLRERNLFIPHVESILQCICTWHLVYGIRSIVYSYRLYNGKACSV